MHINQAAASLSSKQILDLFNNHKPTRQLHSKHLEDFSLRPLHQQDTHTINYPPPPLPLPPPTMQKILVTLSLLASAAVGVLAVDELKIDVTLPVECDRKTQVGDKVSMHYKGTLENGNKFDASYDRGTPFSFKLGSGQVIKGWDEGLQDMCIGEKRYMPDHFHRTYHHLQQPY